jgi:hypothetical protein
MSEPDPRFSRTVNTLNEMTRTALLSAAFLAVFLGNLRAQDYTEYRNAEVQEMVFFGETMAYRDWDASRSFPDEAVRDEKGLLINTGRPPGLKASRLHQKMNPKSLPYGDDPAWQRESGERDKDRALDITINGQGYTSVNPADPCLDVGPNHVIQMINGSSGAYFRIFDKNGTALGAQTYLDNFVNAIGGITAYTGAGDPIVLYDALADRWLMSEFSSSGNRMIVAISTTPDPTGTWYAYSFTAPSFPDYPKYAVWSTMYLITTNESQSATYALDRTRMLQGLSATAQRFTVPDVPTLGFQATTPITHDGGAAPPVGAPGMFMRMADDGWGASIPNDRLELWSLTVNFTTPANSVLSGPVLLATQPFDTELCGYQAFNCIPQPGTTTTLDPLREVIMNRAIYRNFGAHESIACSHVTDVTQTDRAGVRWYELRRTALANPWTIHQQGTYSPDAANRWMSSIAINANGDIGLSYNVSSSTVFPSIRYTGRYASDPLGQMTFTETSIVAGTSRNASNRYGDYNSLDVDPADQSFWGTAKFNVSTAWSTRIFKFSFTPQNVSVSPRVLLEGPYAGGGLMNDGLRSAGIIPLVQPFSTLGYGFTNGGGSESTTAPVLAVTGNNAIVDWVLLELRNSADPSTVVTSRAALLQRDGDVVEMNGTGAVVMNAPPGSYYVAVRHRNHLGIMTATAQSLSAVPLAINFTSAATATWGSDARKDLSGTLVMWSGNTDFSAGLAYTGDPNDRDPILVRIGGTVPTNTVSGYFNEDVNMDGVVRYTGDPNDRDPILVNIGGSVPTNTRAQQLP